MSREVNSEQTDVRMLLSCRVHIGNKNANPRMTSYIATRQKTSEHIINLRMTLEKIKFAARIIAEIE
ncbi:MAG: hypothetical protein EZS28_022642, partial [Streblomastix strix]